MGAGSPWPICGTYIDDWLVTFNLEWGSLVAKLNPRDVRFGIKDPDFV